MAILRYGAILISSTSASTSGGYTSSTGHGGIPAIRLGYGKITVVTTQGRRNIIEIGRWQISGIQRRFYEDGVYGNNYKQLSRGLLDPGVLNFSGFFDALDTSYQERLIDCFSSGKGIGSSSGGSSKHAINIRRMRLWLSTSTSIESKGFWGTTGSTGAVIFITNIESKQDKSGLGMISFSGKISHNPLKFSSST